MTSSDDTALPAGAIAEVAGKVGVSYEGEARGPARVALVCAKFNGAITARLLDGALAGLSDSGGVARHGQRGLGPRRRRASTGRLAPALVGGLRRRRSLSGPSSGATRPTSTSWPANARPDCSGWPSTPACPSSSAFSPPTPWPRPRNGPAPGQTNKGYEAAVTALEMVELLELLPQVTDDQVTGVG